MSRPSTTLLPSLVLSFAVGATLGAHLMRRSSRASNDGEPAESRVVVPPVSLSARESPSFQSPMSKARGSAPLHTVKKEKTTAKNEAELGEQQASDSAFSTPLAVSPMTKARQESPATGSKPTPKVLLSDMDKVPAVKSTNEDGGTQIRLVVQRFGKASLLVAPNKVVRVGVQSHVGLLVYISFSKTATFPKLLQAAKMVLNLPIVTAGVWGDGSGTCSVLDMTMWQGKGVSVMLVPQANLISKVKSLGKSIQYHGQIEKEQGEVLYERFVNTVKALCLQHQCRCRNDKVPAFVTELLHESSTKTLDASVPPSAMFRDDERFSSWNEDTGMPLTTVNGEPLTKSALKKLKKQFEAQRKRHEKYLQTQGSAKASSTTDTKQEDRTDISWSMLDPDFIQVVAGTFGNLQALELKSDMGPFCHVVDL